MAQPRGLRSKGGRLLSVTSLLGGSSKPRGYFSLKAYVGRPEDINFWFIFAFGVNGQGKWNLFPFLFVQL